LSLSNDKRILDSPIVDADAASRSYFENAPAPPLLAQYGFGLDAAVVPRSLLRDEADLLGVGAAFETGEFADAPVQLAAGSVADLLRLLAFLVASR
jgi:hypothetical protein